VSFPRYPAYKDSGVEWLGEVPSEWKVTPLKSIARVINGFPFDSQSFDSNEGFPLVRIRDLNQSSPDTRYKGEFVETASISNDDVLVGMDGDFNVGRWLGETPALLNQRMCCVRAETSMITRYLEYVLPIPLDSINNLTYATTVKHLSSYDVLKIRLAIPVNQSHVAGIVDFLDHETTKIDVLIAEQQRLIELLQEKRQAVISHAVTKGLNPDAPMKDSGVEWLGEVPEHWAVRPLAHLTNLLSYGFTNPMPTSDDGPYMLTANDIGQGSIRFETARRTTSEAFESLLTGKSRPEKDDILITKDGTLGRVAIHDGSLACVNQSVAVMRINQEYLIPGFASASLAGGVYQDRMVYEAGGTTIKHIYISRLAKMPLATPRLKEQSEILEYLGEQLSLSDGLTEQAKTAVELLRERRSALISAAVTGQIDVRGLVPEVAAA